MAPVASNESSRHQVISILEIAFYVCNEGVCVTELLAFDLEQRQMV